MHYLWYFFVFGIIIKKDSGGFNMKKALGSFAIITGAAFIMWIASVLIFAFISGNFNGALSAFLDNFVNLFKSFNTIGNWTIYQYVSFGLLCLTVVFIITWFAVAIAKRKPVYLAFLIYIILGFLPAVGTLLNIDSFAVFSGVETKILIMNILVLTCAGLETIGYIVFLIVGFVAMSKKKPMTVPEEIDDVNSLADSIPEPTIEEPKVGFEEPQPEPVPTFVPGLEPDAEPAPEPTPEPAPEPTPEYANNNNGFDAATLAQAIRDIVRDELARAELNNKANNNATPTNSHSNITGATFAGPLVVQYFQGGISPCTNTPVEEKKEEEKVEEPKPCEEKKEEVITDTIVEETIVEEVKEEVPCVEEEVKEEVQPEPVKEEPKVEEPAPEPVKEEPKPVVEEEKEEKPAKVYERISFIDRMIASDEEMHVNYNLLKNEILSYGVKSRVSNSGDTFRLHKKTYVKITIAGKSLKLYFALDPKDFEDTTMPVQDAGHKGIYADIPLVFKVRSELSMRRCKDLIQTVMEKDNLEQGEVLTTDWVEELKNIAEEKENDED